MCELRRSNRAIGDALCLEGLARVRGLPSEIRGPIRDAFANDPVCSTFVVENRIASANSCQSAPPHRIVLSHRRGRWASRNVRQLRRVADWEFGGDIRSLGGLRRGSLHRQFDPG